MNGRGSFGKLTKSSSCYCSGMRVPCLGMTLRAGAKTANGQKCERMGCFHISGVSLSFSLGPAIAC